MADFETAEGNAAISIWPDTTVRGCLFHFLQACERRWRSEYGSKGNSSWAQIVAQLRTLAACRSPPLFVQLVQKFQSHLHNHGFATYERYWTAQWTEAVPAEQWSCFRELDEIVIRYRTNNVLEGHNQFLKSTVFSHRHFLALTLCCQKLITALQAAWVKLRQNSSQADQVAAPFVSGKRTLVEKDPNGRRLPVAVEIPELLPSINAELQRRGLRAFATVTNGLCMYHSLAVSHGRGASLETLRGVISEVAQFLRNSAILQEQLAPRLLQEGRTFLQFVQAVENGAEGDEGVLQAYANANACRITVLNNSLISQGSQAGAPMPPIHVHPQDAQGLGLAGELTEICIVHLRPM